VKIFLLYTLLSVLIAMPFPSAMAEDAIPVDSLMATSEDEDAKALKAQADEARALTEQVNALVASAQGQRKAIKTLNLQLRKTSDSAEQQALARELEQRTLRLARYRESLEQLTIGAIDVSILSDEESKESAWQDEVQLIMMPILASLKELTAKPRRIEALRTNIDLTEDQLKVIQQALASMSRFEQFELSGGARKKVEALLNKWQERESETTQYLKVARIKLDNLTEQDTHWSAVLSKAYNEFIRDRGVTLLMALIVAVTVVLVLRLLLKCYQLVVRHRRKPRSITRLRIVQFTHGGVTAVLVIASVIAVFYVRSDILLFSLSLIVIVFMMLTLRQLLPRYFTEARLLLNVGAVREGERILLDGVPYIVGAINVHCLFSNPQLEGMRRLSIDAVLKLASRPDHDESWFPTQVDDYVLLADGTFAQVITQSVDFVSLRVKGSPVAIATSVFMQQGVRNISHEGFVIALTFGIDYQHQDIALKNVEDTFKEAISWELRRAGIHGVFEVMVEFKEASANSLDYAIVVELEGAAAAQYFKVQRLIQRACVDACNRRHWGIPFAQLTLHYEPEAQMLQSPRSAA
jgi:hypothetical protein